MKKIAYLIINKNASVKAVAKEVFKLNVIVANLRRENLSSAFLRSQNQNPSSRTIREAFPHTEVALNSDFEEWTNTPSKDAITNGILRDECALNWPLDYVELDENEFEIKTKNIKKTLQKQEIVFMYKNVLMTLPINLNGNTDTLIKNILEKC